MSHIFGSIAQVGYVVRDIDRALDQWVNAVGVGPFFLVRRLEVESYVHRGKAYDMAFSVAVGNSGPLQIELVMPLDDTPSMWNEFLDQGHEGIHHVAYWTKSYD